MLLPLGAGGGVVDDGPRSRAPPLYNVPAAGDVELDLLEAPWETSRANEKHVT